MNQIAQNAEWPMQDDKPGGRDPVDRCFRYWAEWAPIALLVFAVVLGGGVWSVGDVVLAIIGTLMLAIAWYGQSSGCFPRWRFVEWSTVGAFALLAVIHWVPLPFALWAMLPGRAAVAADLAVAGLGAAWLWPSLDDSGMFRSLAALLPGVAILVAVRSDSDRLLNRLGGWMVGLACLSVLMGILQVAGGPDSALRLHDFHNRTGALGFFAYRNLQATHLLMVLPVSVALLLDAYSRARPRTPDFQVFLLVLAIPVLLLGVAMTLSRAGLILGVLALGGCLAMYWAWPGRKQRWAGFLALIAAVAVGIVLIVGLALPRLLDRIGENPLNDGRWALHEGVRETASAFQPVGAGLGSFEQVFQAAPPNVALPGAYMNHAHNEWLQIWLELGWLSLPLGVVTIGAFGMATWRVWRRRPRQSDTTLQLLFARAASISVIVALVHSYFDYPLRTATNLTVFCLVASLLIRVGFSAAQAIPVAPNASGRQFQAR